MRTNGSDHVDVPDGVKKEDAEHSVEERKEHKRWSRHIEDLLERLEAKIRIQSPEKNHGTR